MRAALAVVLTLAACAPAGPKLPKDALDGSIGNTIGDPTTCVLIVDRATGKTVYSYNGGFNCERGLPACDRPGFLSARRALAFASQPGGRKASCNSVPDGSRTVGRAEGPVMNTRPDVFYSPGTGGHAALA